MFTYRSIGYVTAQILLPIVNTGTTWISLDEYDSQFTIYDASGGIVETGNFDAAAPKRVAPGGTSLLVGEVFSDDHPIGDYVSVEADGYFERADDPSADIGVLLPDNVRTRAGSLDGVQVVGELSNLGLSRIDNADVVAIFYNAAGEVIGYASGYVENIEPMGTRAFQIDSSFAKIKLGDIARTEVFGSPWDF